MSFITGSLVICFASNTLAAVIPSSGETQLPVETTSISLLDTQAILDDTESSGEIPIIDDNIVSTDVPILDDIPQENDDPKNDEHNETCDEMKLNCPNPRQIDLEAREFPLTDQNDTDFTQNKNTNYDEKKTEILSKIESALKKSKSTTKCCNSPTASTSSGLPLDLIPIFKPRRYMPPDNKEVLNGNNAVNPTSNQDIISTEVQYSNPNCGYKPANVENKLSSDDWQALIRTKPCPSTDWNNWNPLNLIKPANARIRFENRPCNSCNSVFNPNDRPLKIVRITEEGKPTITQEGSSIQRQCPTNVCNRNSAKIVIYKPEKIIIEEVCGNFLKKKTMDVLIPFYVSQIPPPVPG